MKRRENLPRVASILVPLLLVLAAAIFVATASAAAPSNTAAPTISGTAREAQTLTASNGSWNNSPTSFSYQWQRCSLDGTGCADIATATSQGYLLTAADVDNRVRVNVTAANADGHAAASSDVSEVISSATGPTLSTKPTITGTPAVGQELTAHPGTWTGATAVFGYQWLSCSATASFDCLAISGATGSTYGVRSGDAGKQLRVVVRATSTPDSHGWATSDPTAAVPGTATTTTTTTTTTATTTVVTTTVPARKAPTISFLSLRRSGTRVFARFKVCTSRPGQVTIIERDNKARALSYTRNFRATIVGCGTFSRNWIPAARFRTHGRYVVTLRAQDSVGLLSLLVSRSLTR
jgi:hypothetical protein